MQLLNALIAIGGDEGNTVPKYGITPTEVAVLRAIHGDASVFDLEPVGEVKRSHREELAIVKARYGNARTTENEVIVDLLFPGAAARVFETLDELYLPEEFMKPASRVKSNLFGGKGDHDGDGAVGGAAPAAEEGLHALTVKQLRELAEKSNIDLGDATRKDDIVAAIEAAQTAVDVDEKDDDDGVGEMSDAGEGALFK
jgi:hypothetical protein